jgi:prepilin-type N-terminal cleavage/methylation domain-containing protein
MKRWAKRAFSLLEVMVAIAILGLTLTVILSAQGGLAASNRSAANMGTAVSFGRCKMTELEEKLLKLGFQETDQIETAVACCDDQLDERFKCDFKVEKIELPNMNSGYSLGDGGTLLGANSALLGPQNVGGGLSNIDALYSRGRDALARYVFNDELRTPVLRHALGDSAGVVGAALLDPPG